jgi:signal transduction histidine kinase
MPGNNRQQRKAEFQFNQRECHVTQNQPTVLIISDDAEFLHAISARWQLEAVVPVFTVLSGDPCPALRSEDFDVAIIGGLTDAALTPIIQNLGLCGRPVLFIREADDTCLPATNGLLSITTLARSDADWPQAAVLIISQLLGTGGSAARIRELLEDNRKLSRDAALGRYILETRHSLNNALTSVLGNSELLSLDPDFLAPLDPKLRMQIDTIHNMALRIHEILQRFSSLEKELILEQQWSTVLKAKAQVAGLNR